MNAKFCITSLALALATRVGAVVSSSTVNATIPDGDLTGFQSSQVLSGLSGLVTDVNVTLNISGGFNGDYYAYLSHSGVISILLNRTGKSSSSGVGYGDAGFGPDTSANQFTFDDQAGHDVHLYRTFSFTLNASELTGQWQPDGRLIDPLSSGATFDSAARNKMLSGFNGLGPNGTWTLFLADVSAGGQGTLVSWGLDMVTAVPEPGSAGMLVALGSAFVYRRGRR
jgi:subtilisin-like proprotein convertase family protein